MSSFYSKNELLKLGINLPKHIENIKVSRFARFYLPHLITLNNNIRIDDFCILSGSIEIDSYTHVGASVKLFGGNKIAEAQEGKGIRIGKFCSISSNSILYATNDDFSGEHLISPIVPFTFTNVTYGSIILENHVQIGAGCILLPNATCKIGSVLGAMSLLKKSMDSFCIYAGVPAIKIKERSKKILSLEKEFMLSIFKKL